MHAIFQKNGKKKGQKKKRAKKCLKRAKTGKTPEKLGKNVKDLKIFLKRAGD